MGYILFDDYSRENLLPLTFTRPVSEIRIGILTIKEKWENYLNSNCSYKTEDYLSKKYSSKIENDNILINSSYLPKKEIINQILKLNLNEAIIENNNIIAVRLNKEKTENFNFFLLDNLHLKVFEENIVKINYPWDIFSFNGTAIESDFDLITKNKKSQDSFQNNNNIINPEKIFIEEGAKVTYSSLNASSGPIYIGKDSEIMEGSVVRGPFALCENSTLKLSTKIYGPTTIGPHCKVGGEINNSVIFGFSNKAHDGFLGNSVLGEWCNIGADSNNSNLKNNYSEVRLWNYKKESFVKTGLTFCGLIMGDHSKCGINTMFNTGTVVGVSANIFGSGFPRNFVPSYSWGGASGFEKYDFKKALEVAKIVIQRRDLIISENDIEILQHVFDITEKYRKF